MSKEERYLKRLEELLYSSIDEEVIYLKKKISETIKYYEQYYDKRLENVDNIADTVQKRLNSGYLVKEEDYEKEATRLFDKAVSQGVADFDEQEEWIQDKKDELKDINYYEATKDGVSNKTELRENLINLLNNERSMYTSEANIFWENYEICPTIEVVVDQVVAVELDDMNFIEDVKSNLKNFFKTLDVPDTIFTLGGTALIGVIFGAIVNNTFSFGSALLGVGTGLALLVSSCGIKSAISILSAKKNYENNLEILKKYGLYEYVQQIIEIRKQQLERLLEESKNKDGKKR